MSKKCNGKSPSKYLLRAHFSRWISIISMVIYLSNGSLPSVLASEAVSNNLSASQIVEKSREAYASLSSYSDEGRSVTSIGGGTVAVTFTTKLARPDFYQIIWVQNSGASSFGQSSIQAVWFSGAGNLLDTEWGTQEQYNRKIALFRAAALSAGVAAKIPMTFFRIKTGDMLENSAFTAKQQADEKVGGVDCYVITWTSRNHSKTLWIGKQDFLIRQIRTAISAEAMRAAVAEWDPELTPRLLGFNSIETHTNIVVNKRLSEVNFVPPFSTTPPIDSE